MTLGTVNAFVASHYFVVPTILDRVSSEAVVPFLNQVETLRADLDLDLRLAAIVGMMTRTAIPNATEQRYLDQAVSAAREMGAVAKDDFEVDTIPRRVQVTNEADLAYFLSDNNGSLASQFYNPIFNKLWTRITGQE